MRKTSRRGFVVGMPVAGCAFGVPVLAAGPSTLVTFSHDSTFAAGTVEAKLKRNVSIFDPPYSAVAGQVDQNQRIANAVAFQAAIDAVAVEGGEVIVDAPRLEFAGRIRARSRVAVRGFGKDSTVLACYPSDPSHALAIDLKGGSAEERIIACWSGFTLDMTNAGSSTHGFRVGHNYRSFPLLRDIKVWGSGGHGIWFDADNWIVSLENVEVNQCGRNDHSGLFATPSITDMNDVTLRQVNVESCGGTGSAVGGIDFRFAGGTNRGWVFDSVDIEGCLGASEASFANMNGIKFSGLYVERSALPHIANGIEFENCHGVISGGVVAAALGSPSARRPIRTPLVGLRFMGGSNFTVEGVVFSNWATAAIAALDRSRVHVRNNLRGSLSREGNAKITGDS